MEKDWPVGWMEMIGSYNVVDAGASSPLPCSHHPSMAAAFRFFLFTQLYFEEHKKRRRRRRRMGMLVVKGRMMMIKYTNTQQKVEACVC